MGEDHVLYGGGSVKKFGVDRLLDWLDGIERSMLKAISGAGLLCPRPLQGADRKAQGGHLAGRQDGGGLAADRRDDRAGPGRLSQHRLCPALWLPAQPHRGQGGWSTRSGRCTPSPTSPPIDYDPSATKVNQENRIKLMLAVAKERLENPRPRGCKAPHRRRTGGRRAHHWPARRLRRSPGPFHKNTAAPGQTRAGSPKGPALCKDRGQALFCSAGTQKRAAQPESCAALRRFWVQTAMRLALDLESAHAGIHGGSAQLLLDAEQLVVLGNTLGTAGSTGLDLAGVQSHSQVRQWWCPRSRRSGER